MADKKAMLGHKIRRFRQDLGLNQSELAEQLEISPSYLNLIEHNQRPVTVPLLFRLSQSFDIDLREFAEDEEARHAAGLAEVFGDPLFEGQAPGQPDIRAVAAASPAAARSVIALYNAYRTIREDAQALAHQLADDDALQALGQRGQPLQEVRDYQESRSNHFPELEAAAEDLREGAHEDGLFQSLVTRLRDLHGIGVKVMPVDVLQDTIRRYDQHRRRVLLSEILPPSGRIFHLAAQIAFLDHSDMLDRIAGSAGFTSDEARKLMRAGLSNYFAAAVMMPYDSFLTAARELRFDIDILCRRFGASFEQAAHRLTTLQRPAARGIPFFFLRVDAAGNVSKRLSGGGFQFARFGGACPRWIVHHVFRSPGAIRRQVVQLPDGGAFFTLARTADPIAGWGQGPGPQYAIGLGCDIKDAGQLVYADGVDLKNMDAATPIGVSCRLCERLDCSQRAYPPINHRLSIEDHIRRLTPFTFAQS